ncbi:protein NLRC3-like [Dysidea avara]|uniref:protein NLRC3-like n=1 Tax=Dysidea avara TaxID=196820 RepID=UPI003329CD74
MAIIVFLCLLGSLPQTATKMFASFILHTVCRHLKRTGKITEDEHINKVEHLPQPFQQTLQQLQKVAFDGLVEDKIVFTMNDLPDMCRDDPTCYGLLQSVECYCSDEIGTPTKSFNFLHLGIQEYFAAKYVATLPENKVYTLLEESFLVTEYDPDSKSARLSNMWIMYCGITSGQCISLRHYLSNFEQHNMIRNDYSLPQTGPSDNRSTSISQDILKDPVKVLYLFQCFQEAQDDKFCGILSKSFDSGRINISTHRFLPHQVVSLGFFLSRSHRNWKELNLEECYIGDNGINLLHHYLCGDKANKEEVIVINLNQNYLSSASSPLIGDIITHLQPHTLKLDGNHNTSVRDISTAVTNTDQLRVLYIIRNNTTSTGAIAVANSLLHNTSLEVLDTSFNPIGQDGATAIAQAITNNKTLKKLNINNCKITSTGARAIANSLLHNASLEVLLMSNNAIGQDGAIAIALAITNNKTLKILYLYGDGTINEESAIIIIKSIHYNNIITKLWLFPSLRDNGNVKRAVERINSTRRKCYIQELEVEYY